MTAFGAAREQARQAQLGVPLELPLARVVVERDLGMVDEPGELVEVVEVVLGDLTEGVALEGEPLDDPCTPGPESSKDPPGAPTSERRGRSAQGGGRGRVER
jgi:hypothetical protein